MNTQADKSLQAKTRTTPNLDTQTVIKADKLNLTFQTNDGPFGQFELTRSPSSGGVNGDAVSGCIRETTFAMGIPNGLE